jgi:hypothetical protein
MASKTKRFMAGSSKREADARQHQQQVDGELELPVRKPLEDAPPSEAPARAEGTKEKVCQSSRAIASSLGMTVSERAHWRRSGSCRQRRRAGCSSVSAATTKGFGCFDLLK